MREICEELAKYTLLVLVLAVSVLGSGKPDQPAGKQLARQPVQTAALR